MTTRTITINLSNPEEVAAFYAVWRLSDERRAAIKDRADYAAKCARITAERGIGAVVEWQMTGIDPEARADRRAA